MDLKFFRRQPIYRYIVAIFMVAILSDFAQAQNDSKSKTDSIPSEVSQAEKHLLSVGLRRAGKKWLATESNSIGKRLGALTRSKRELRKLNERSAMAFQALRKHDLRIRQLTVRDGQLGLELAKVAGIDTVANNRIVGLINAVRAEKSLASEQRKKIEANYVSGRGKLNDAEAAYTKEVMEIREQITKAKSDIGSAMGSQSTIDAFQKVNAFYGTTNPESPDALFVSLERKLVKVEQEIYKEDIPLDVKSNSLYVNVVVGDKTEKMVVDTGASLICLPKPVADRLGVVVKDTDPPVNLTLADGRSIPARRVILPKVRVGTFEAENVAATVFDTNALAAEPLLGMSYLGRFRTELDKNAKTLRMLRVDN